MTDYRIEKPRCPVLVVLAGGENIRGDIFVNPLSRFRPGPQGACEFLNEPDAFFALAPAGAAPMLVSKESVERVEAPLPGRPAAPADPADPPTYTVNVELMLRGGTACVGTVELDMPGNRLRLLDYLNSHRERFLPVMLPDRLMLINRKSIALAHELA